MAVQYRHIQSRISSLFIENVLPIPLHCKLAYIDNDNANGNVVTHRLYSVYQTQLPMNALEMRLRSTKQCAMFVWYGRRAITDTHMIDMSTIVD
jgi:hypothetical protein